MTQENSTLAIAGHSLLAADLDRARRYLEALIQMEPAESNKTVREALTLAAIVSYWRPFARSCDANGKMRAMIPQTVAGTLPPNLERLHAAIKAQRDEAWAHTDWKQHEPTVYRDGESGLAIPISRNPWSPLTPSAASEFLELVKEIDRRTVDVPGTPASA